MYYPYLRGKQFELIILLDNAKSIAKHKIHPIIEPVKSDFKSLVRAFKVLNEEKVACTLIVNPQAGENPVKLSNILHELINESVKNHKNLSIGYILDAESRITDLIALLDKYLSCQYLCELLKHIGFHGIIYKSSISEGNNYVLFRDRKLKAKNTYQYQISNIKTESEELNR